MNISFQIMRTLCTSTAVVLEALLAAGIMLYLGSLFATSVAIAFACFLLWKLGIKINVRNRKKKLLYGHQLPFQKPKRLSQHFGRVFISGTFIIFACCLIEPWVNSREESSGIGRFFRLEVPTDGQLALFRCFYTNRVNCAKQAACFV